MTEIEMPTHPVVEWRERAEKAEARVAELEALIAAGDECDEREHQEDVKRRGETDARLRSVLGSCWNHMWGPPLEQLGGDYDALKERIFKLERGGRLVTRATQRHGGYYLVPRADLEELHELLQPPMPPRSTDD